MRCYLEPPMPEIRTVTTLRAKRDEIQKAIANYERQLTQSRADLASISAAIRIFEVTGETLDVSSYTDLHRIFRRGETTALCKEALAESGPQTTRELVRFIMVRKELDVADAVLAKALAQRVVHTLNLAARAGHFADAGRSKGVRIWALP
jgi:hypothetical protein